MADLPLLELLCDKDRILTECEARRLLARRARTAAPPRTARVDRPAVASHVSPSPAQVGGAAPSPVSKSQVNGASGMARAAATAAAEQQKPAR